MGLKRDSWEGTLYSWLTVVRGRHRANNTHVDMGMLFMGWGYQNRIPVMMYAVSSHRICHLPEVQDDVFYIMSLAARKGQPYITGEFSPLHMYVLS